MAMVTYEEIMSAQKEIVDCWGEHGKRVIEAIYASPTFDAPFDEFLGYCTACGGNWGGMFLSGLKEIYPEVWEAIPEDMGVFAFGCICDVLLLCGINTKEG